MQKLLIFIFSILITVSCSSKISKQEVADKCLNYGPKQVQLSGILNSKSFPGPPNYEDVKRGDKEEIYWFIKTMEEFCVNDSKDNWSGKLVNQSEVQLVLLSSVFDFYTTKKSFLGKRVLVKGTLLPQMSGHHRTQVLITVESLEKVNE